MADKLCHGLRRAIGKPVDVHLHTAQRAAVKGAVKMALPTFW